MHRKNRGKRWLSLLLTAVMLVTMVPAAAFGAVPERGVAPKPDEGKFKYFRAMAADGSLTPISTFMNEADAEAGREAGTNEISHLINLSSDQKILLKFALSHSQEAAISLYKADESFYTDMEKMHFDNPQVLAYDQTDPAAKESFLGEYLGHINAVHIDGNVITDDEGYASLNPDFTDEKLQEAIDAIDSRRTIG